MPAPNWRRRLRPPPTTHNDTTKPRNSRRRVARARAVLTRTILSGEEIETNDARDDFARVVCSDVGRARAPPHAPSVGAAAAAAAAIACRDGARVRVSKRPSAARARERRSKRRVTHAVKLHTYGYVGRARASLRTPSRASSVAAAAAAAAPPPHAATARASVRATTKLASAARVKHDGSGWSRMAHAIRGMGVPAAAQDGAGWAGWSAFFVIIGGAVSAAGAENARRGDSCARAACMTSKWRA